MFDKLGSEQNARNGPLQSQSKLFPHPSPPILNGLDTFHIYIERERERERDQIIAFIFSLFGFILNVNWIKCNHGCKCNHWFITWVHLINWVLKSESLNKYNEIKKHKQFFKECQNHKILLKELLVTLKKQNKKILGYGASTKGNVLLQYCNINSKLINFIAEVNKFKFNKYTPGSNIKIISEKQAKLKNPDYMLVLPWHFKDHIIKREHKFLKNGGKLIFPLPDIEII